MKLAEQVPDRVIPVPEWLLDGFAGVPDQRVGEQPKRLRSGCLGCGEVQAADLLGECLQQVAFALSAPPADDTECGVLGGVSGERREPLPFPFPVEDPLAAEIWFRELHITESGFCMVETCQAHDAVHLGVGA